MTAAQLRHLADLNAQASDFYRRTNPPSARRFADAAKTAGLLAGHLADQEHQASIQLGLNEVKADLGVGVA